MGSFVDRTGDRFGRLLVVEREAVEGRVRWICQCDCGARVSVLAAALVSGNTVSCGCYGDERRRAKGKNVSHGLSGSRTYEIWSGMKKRCLNPKNDAFPRYGGRGITVCQRWLSFENFLADMGEVPEGLSIERLHNDKGYEPSNCIWADSTVQGRNRRNTRMVNLDGETLPLIEAADRLGIGYSTAYYRFVLTQLENVEQLMWD